MRSWSFLLTAASLAPYTTAFSGGHRDILHDPFGHELRRRNVVYDGQIASSYDFVIVGGGTAGLTLASRLSEDANTTVLVLEAGDTGDAVKDTVDIPGNAYWQSLLHTTYDWEYTTVSQPGAANRSISWPGGKILGGSSALNGMYQVRPSEVEVDLWASLNAGENLWNWDTLFAAMKKGENFTAPSAEIEAEAAIEFAAQSHGTSGPLQVSYPGFIVPIVGNWTQTLANAGIPKSPDANGGDGWGGFIAASAINPANWTRSYSRSAYIDPLPPRPNLSILPNATVTRLIFSTNATNLTVNSVEYAASSDAPRLTVNVTKEVILSSGAVGSPHVLLNSGIGPQDVLTAANVPVVYALPGVGQHLQDHVSTELVWKTNAETAATIHTANYSNTPDDDQSSPFLSFVNSATCYANTSILLGSNASSSFIADVSSAIDTSASSLVPSTDPTVVAGYKAIYNATAQLLSSSVGQVEILLALTGTSQGGDQSVAIQAALQHPFSQGRLYINSSNPFDYPVIDPQYFSHSADQVLLREGLKLARIIGNTAPLNSAMLDEVFPGSSVQTDDDWDTWLAGQYSTEFHPSCSLAMLPLELGGVVDTTLKVYGTSNVRVVDASVFPFEFSAHMMAPVYGLAEQAANIIRAQYNGLPPPTSSSSSTSQAAPSSTSTTNNPVQTLKGTDKNSASLTRPHVALSLLAILACVVAAL